MSDTQIKSLSLIPLFEQLYHTIFTITKRFPGANKLFIAFDGIAPVTKWNLQKKRRFSYLTLNNLDEKSAYFGREALTPGSTLMALLERTLFWISKDFLLSKFPSTKNLSPLVVIDSSSRPGEAEWKTIQFLRLSIQEQILSKGLTQDKFSIANLLKERNSPFNFRRILCASDADSMLMALAYPIQSLFMVDVSHSSNQNVLFSPNLIIKSLACINPNSFLELRDGLFLLSLLCIGSDYVSRLRGMPSLHEAWRSFLAWTKDQSDSSNWHLIDRNKRCVNLVALQDFLSFCKYSKNLIFISEDPKDNILEDEIKIDEESTKSCPVDAYLSVLACNLDILYTGICRFFSIDRVFPPSIDDVINWKSFSGNKQIKTPFCIAPDSSLLVPGAMAMMLIPNSRLSCLATPLHPVSSPTDDSLSLSFTHEDDPLSVTPSITVLEENIRKLSSFSFSPFEKDFTFSRNYPSVITLPNGNNNDSRPIPRRDKFSKLFSSDSSPSFCGEDNNNFIIQGHIPFGISSSINPPNISVPYASVPSLYQSNNPDVGTWTFLESEIGIFNSILDKCSKNS